MPYVTSGDVADGGNGVASDADDFVRNKLATFLTSATHFPSSADRWSRSKADVNLGTSEYDVFLTPGSNALAKGAPYMAFHTRDQRIFMFAADGFDAATPSYDQPGGIRGHPGDNLASTAVPGTPWNTSDRHQCQWVNVMGAGPYISHHLFAPADGSYIHAAIQVATRRWRHMWWGAMEKFGSFTGGAYSCGHYQDQTGSTFGGIDVPNDNNNVFPGCGHSIPTGIRACNLFKAGGIRAGLTADWFQSQANFTGTATYTRTATNANFSSVNGTSVTVGAGQMSAHPGGPGSLHFLQSPSLFSGFQPFVPVLIWASVAYEGDDRLAPLGRIPDVARVSMKYFTPGQQVTIGADNWRVFPVCNSDAAGTVNDQEYTGYEGYAYRERT